MVGDEGGYNHLPSVPLNMAPSVDLPTSDAATSAATRPAPRKYYGKTAKLGALWSLLRQGGHEAIALPTAVLMARLLTPADFGIAAAASFFIVLSTRVTQLGFNSALVKVKEMREAHLASVFVVNLVLGTLTCLVLVLGAPFIARVFDSPATVDALKLSAVVFLITPFSTVPAALTARRMNFSHSAAAQWLDTIVGCAVAVGLALKGYGFWSIVWGHLCGVAVQAVTIGYLSRWRPSLRFSMAATRELLSFGLGVHAKRLLQFACFNLDTLVVGSVLGVTALGFYDKAFTTMNRLVTRLAVGQANFRIFSIIQDDSARFRRAYLRLIFTVSLVGLPAFGAAIVAAPALFTVLFGETWLPAVLPFQILCVGGLLKLYDGYASQANEALGGIWAQVRRQAVGAVLVVVGAWFGSRLGGVIGAAIGVSSAIAILSVTMQALVRQMAGLTWREMLGAQIPGVACTVGLVVVMLLAAILVRYAIPQPAAWQLLAAEAVAGCGFYAVFLQRSPFKSVRNLVQETATDLGLDRRLGTSTWLRWTHVRQSRP